MKEIIFLIEEDVDGGYNAQALGYSIYTEGETVNELRENIKEALHCHFDSEDIIPGVVRLHFVREELMNYA
jgi:predicted RNase H-like HicB family nuclease